MTFGYFLWSVNLHKDKPPAGPGMCRLSLPLSNFHVGTKIWLVFHIWTQKIRFPLKERKKKKKLQLIGDYTCQSS